MTLPEHGQINLSLTASGFFAHALPALSYALQHCHKVPELTCPSVSYALVPPLHFMQVHPVGHLTRENQVAWPLETCFGRYPPPYSASPTLLGTCQEMRVFQRWSYFSVQAYPWVSGTIRDLRVRAWRVFLRDPLRKSSERLNVCSIKHCR